MSNTKSPRANIAGRIAGAAIAGALLIAGPVAAVATAGPAAAAPGTTNANGQGLTDEQLTNVGNNLPPAGFFSLNPFKEGSIPQQFLKDFFD